MKLNWFSPLPPARSAIAAYSMAVLPALSRHADVTVWTSAPDAEVSNGSELRRYRPQSPPWAEINRADVSIYHIGNHALFHGDIWDLSRRNPGIVVLHDARLQDLVAGWALLRGDWGKYTETMGRCYGASGVAAAQDVSSGAVDLADLVQTFPLTAAFVDRALGVVVHSEDARGLVESASGKPILCLPLAYRATRTALPARRWRAPFRLMMFGFIGRNRGLDAILAALAALPERKSFHLDIYGDLPEADHWVSRIHSEGLGAHVTAHGFVSDEALAGALDRAHVVLNLRNPPRGEASFSLLQAWDHGLPCIVNDVGWFGEVPASCVAFARHDHTQEDVVRHLQRLLKDPEEYRALGMAGRERLLQQHTAGAYAERLFQFAVEARNQRRRSNALHMADRAAAALRDVGGKHVEEWAVRRVGGVVHDLVAPRRPSFDEPSRGGAG